MAIFAAKKKPVTMQGPGYPPSKMMKNDPDGDAAMDKQEMKPKGKRKFPGLK
jgi:hypothetical protein